MPILELESVSYVVQNRRIIDAISVTLRPGERSLVLGANGAGKSVLLRLCHGLLEPTSGRIGWQRPGRSPVRQAMVFQRPIMLRRCALANVAHALASRGISRTERQARAYAALGKVGLAHVAERPARALSGGEQQRLALARAWALEPEVLFLDEPTANLDPVAVAEIESVIQAIHDAGTKIIMTTHNLGQARRLGDEILFIADGRLIERARADTFFACPVTPQAVTFLRGELP